MKVKLFKIRLIDEFITHDEAALNDFLEIVTLKKSATELVQCEPKYWSVFLYYDDSEGQKDKFSEKKFISPLDGNLPVLSQNKKMEDVKDSDNLEEPLSPLELSRLDSLKIWRNETALRLNLPGYMVTSNVTLTNISRVNPQSIEELIFIKGLGPNKVEKYGADIIALLNSI
jgi:superfamily II DNA helicase RecQ